jgi:tRNA-modifying protein YgfZ
MRSIVAAGRKSRKMNRTEDWMTFSMEQARQYAAFTSGAGYAELPGRTLLEVSGRDAAPFLHSFTTNDIKKLPVGRGCEAFVTSPPGKTLGHVLIFRGEKSLLLSTTPGQATTLIGHLSRYVISEDVEFRDLTSERATLLLAGPRAAEVLGEVFGVSAPAELLAWQSVTFSGQPLTIARVECVTAPSYFLFVPASELAAIGTRLQFAGAIACSEAVVDAARIEAGVPLFGRDITDDNLPQEIARDAKAISFTKGCYLGQETIARIDALGHVNRQLVGVRFAGQEVPTAGMLLAAGGKEVGHVTSAAWSPELNAPLAMALVRRAQAKAGTELTSPLGPATVVSLPLA